MLKERFSQYIKKSVPFCCAPWVGAQIRTNGDIYVCCHTFGSNVSLGNCVEKGFMPVWYSNSYQKIRAAHRKSSSKDIPGVARAGDSSGFICLGRASLLNCPGPIIIPSSKYKA